jgi:hypothetical protein
MPLTSFQSELALLLSKNRSEDSHLAGGAALHRADESLRYSEDLDYFHDSEERVASAFAGDRKLLEKHGYVCKIEINQPGYVRCLVSKEKNSTKVEWAHDSAWRFMPPQAIKGIGFVLHPIDLAINKLLALAGRDEARDYLDVLRVNEEVLPLGALCWAACGKDPGLSPSSLMELLKRRGKYRPEDFTRLNLKHPVNVQELKQQWLSALASAESFIGRAPPADLGCLYYSKSGSKFIEPTFNEPSGDVVLHRGRPGGILPILK